METKPNRTFVQELAYYMDTFALDIEDQESDVDISYLIDDENIMNISVMTIIAELHLEFRNSNGSILDNIIESDDEETREWFVDQAVWADREKILQFLIDKHKELNGHTKPHHDFDFSPFLRDYIDSIIEG